MPENGWVASFIDSLKMPINQGCTSESTVEFALIHNYLFTAPLFIIGNSEKVNRHYRGLIKLWYTIQCNH